MATTNFETGTVITKEWLNDVNEAVYNPASIELSATNITNTPAGSIAATNVQTALNELDTEKAPRASPVFTGTATIPAITGMTTPLSVAQGGVGAATLTANNVLLGNGTSAVQVVAPGTSGNVLTSNGTTWASSAPASNAFTSTVRVHTANGFGSTNTKIRRFTTTVQSAGSDITYSDSATDGASFTINTTGMYGISYSENSNTQFNIGISLNSTELTTDISDITANDRLVIAYSAAGTIESVSTSVYLTAADIIRPHSTGVAATSNARTNFTISRIG